MLFGCGYSGEEGEKCVEDILDMEVETVKKRAKC